MQTKEATLMSQRGSWITILDIVLATFTCAAALAVIGGVVSDPPRVAASENRKEGKILPPTARPHGYSLSEIAKITAVFNSGDHSGPPPVTSFQILYTSKTNNNTFDVGPDTMFYVPVIFFDDSPPIPEISPSPSSIIRKIGMIREIGRHSCIMSFQGMSWVSIPWKSRSMTRCFRSGLITWSG